ncbi:MAG: hypothetical protein ABIJ34_02985 [archaeon]
MKRGQISVEFITVFGFIFLMTIPMVLIFFNQLGSVRDSLAQNQLRNLAIKLADKAESIYYLGEPSKTMIKAYFPEHIKFINISRNEILFGIVDSNGIINEIYSVSQVDVTGDLSTDSGLHYIIIEASQGTAVIKE